MNIKKTLIYLSVITIVSSVVYTLITRQETKNILDSIPLISKSNPTPNISPIPQNKPITIPAVDKKTIVKDLDTDKSITEIDKLSESLPVYIKDFKTKAGLTCTINLYIAYDDPVGTIRLEIYGPNYNEQNLQGQNALSFKECFTEIKNTFTLKKVNLKDIIFIYSNRQYIQDTSTYWVKSFNLLD